MSNHRRLVVSDPEGVLPEFLRELHRTMAKALNALQGHWESLLVGRGGGTRMEVLRPTAYFDSSGEMPKRLQLRIEPPAGISGDLENWRGRMAEAVAAKVRQVRATAARQGPAVLVRTL